MFGWGVLQDRLPTVSNYGEEGVIRDVHCIFCFNEIETASHFLDWTINWLHWKVTGWGDELVANFHLLNSLCIGKKGKSISFN